MFKARSKAKAEKEAKELLAAYRHNRRTIRRNERKKSKQLYALAFSIVGRSMLSLHEWKECYCVCRAWKIMLSNDDLWKRRLQYLEPVKHVKRLEASMDGAAQDTLPSPRKVWHPLNYRQLACSKLSLMFHDYESITWNWDCNVVLTHSFELLSQLFNVYGNLKLSYKENRMVLETKFEKYYPSILTIQLKSGRFDFPMLRKRMSQLKETKELHGALDTLSRFKREDGKGRLSYRLLPLIKHYGMKNFVQALLIIFRAVNESVRSEVNQRTSENNADISVPLTRPAFVMMLLSTCQKYLLANNIRTEMIWGGNHPEISDDMSRHSWDYGSIGSIAKSYVVTKENWVPEVEPLFRVVCTYKTVYSRKNFLSKVVGLRNGLGQVFLAINYHNGHLYLQGENHNSCGETILWNEYLQLQSQNLRNGLGRKTTEAFYSMATRCVLSIIDRKSLVWPTPLHVVNTRFHHANILAWAHGRVASWELDGPNPAKEVAVLIMFRDKTEYVSEELLANDSEGDVPEIEELRIEVDKERRDHPQNNSLWGKVSSPGVVDIGRKETQARKEEYTVGYSTTWN